MPDTLDGCEHFGPGRIRGTGVVEIGEHAVKGLRGMVTLCDERGGLPPKIPDGPGA